MDVTFIENQPYYHKTNIQGENTQDTSLEYQFWDSIDCQEPEETKEPESSISTNHSPSPTKEFPASTVTELHVYSRRQFKPKENEAPTCLGTV